MLWPNLDLDIYSFYSDIFLIVINCIPKSELSKQKYAELQLKCECKEVELN